MAVFLERNVNLKSWKRAFLNILVKFKLNLFKKKRSHTKSKLFP